jgi:16S rRNA (guanine527-N7)-methyltransferase
MIIISDQLITDTLLPYGFSPDEEHTHAIKQYISLLLLWNARISLTTVVDPIEILRFHFGESLYAAVCVPILNGRLADLGSGAGFPGLALRLALPDLALTMIESNMKKVAFLREVVQELKMEQVKVVRDRMENVPKGGDLFDFVTARAVGNHAATLKWARANLTNQGKVALWLGEEDVSAVSAHSKWKWSDPFRIPGSARRFILSGSPSV